LDPIKEEEKQGRERKKMEWGINKKKQKKAQKEKKKKTLQNNKECQENDLTMSIDIALLYTFFHYQFKFLLLHKGIIVI